MRNTLFLSLVLIASACNPLSNLDKHPREDKNVFFVENHCKETVNLSYSYRGETREEIKVSDRLTEAPEVWIDKKLEVNDVTFKAYSKTKPQIDVDIIGSRFPKRIRMCG